MQCLCQAAQIHTAFPTILDGDLIQKFDCIFAPRDSFDSLLDRSQIIQIFLHRRIDLAAQDNIAMSLHDVFKSHACQSV